MPDQDQTMLGRTLVVARRTVQAREETALGRTLELVRIDFDPSDGQPSPLRVLVASAAALVGSLGADALIAAIAVAAVPADKGYVHFQFSDYAKLTVVGVLVACAAWPVVTRLTSAPRLAFFRMAVVVTLVLWVPDVYIWYRGQPLHAVLFLMLMHLTIALVTYNLLVHVAPPVEQP